MATQSRHSHTHQTRPSQLQRVRAIRKDQHNTCIQKPAPSGTGSNHFNHRNQNDMTLADHKLQNDILVIDASIETILYQVHNLRNHVSREQLRCWNIHLKNLQGRRKSLLMQLSGPSQKQVSKRNHVTESNGHALCMPIKNTLGLCLSGLCLSIIESPS